MDQVRALVEDDIPQIAELHAKVYGGCDRPASPALRAYFTQIFCRHPWSDEDLPSLVYQQSNGNIVGVLGVMPRPMSMNGRPIRAAINHNFMVEPGKRATLAAVELIKAFLSRPHDLCLAEGNDLSRKMFEGFGGTRSLLYSIRWTRPLRPGQYVLSFSRRCGLPTTLACALRPFCYVVDTVATKMPQSPFRQMVPRVSGEELNSKTLLACLSEFSRSRSLRPEYDDRSLTWLLELHSHKRGLGTFHNVVVRNAQQKILGYYLYHLNPGGIAEVVQIAAEPNSINEVFDYLFYDAWRHGVIALSGQLDPKFMQVFSDRQCLFRGSGGSWILVHSKHPEVLQAIHRGDAFLSRLEGEWWISFGAEYV